MSRCVSLKPGSRALPHEIRRGQALTEFALAFVAFFLVIGGIIQFGMILWSLNTVTQVAKDTARWAATESTSPCDTAGNRTSVAATAGRMALQLSLLGYPSGTWTTASPFDAVGAEGVGADWLTWDDGTEAWLVPQLPLYTGLLFPSDCPPADSQTRWVVRVRVNHVVPIFFPGLQLLAPPCPLQGFCIGSTAQLQMEPKSP
jgi:TadE-like protein